MSACSLLIVCVGFWFSARKTRAAAAAAAVAAVPSSVDVNDPIAMAIALASSKAKLAAVAAGLQPSACCACLVFLFAVCYLLLCADKPMDTNAMKEAAKLAALMIERRLDHAAGKAPTFQAEVEINDYPQQARFKVRLLLVW